MTIFGFLGILIGTTNAMLSIFVYFQDRKNKLNRLWALHALSVSMWGFGSYLITLATNIETAIIFWRIAAMGVIFIPSTFIIFTNSFLEKENVLITHIVIFISVVFSILDFTPYFLSPLRFVFNSFYWIEPTFSYHFFIAFFVITITYAIARAFKHSQTTKDLVRKKQIFFFALASSIGFLGGSSCFLLTYGFNLYPYLNISIVIFSVIITYTIIRHRLFNIRVIAAQIITIGLWLFILIRLAFAQNATEFFIESTLFTISLIFGIFLIHAVFREVRQRERIEKLAFELQNLNLTLHQKVAEQTLEIRHALESEKKARQELEKLNDAKDQFIMITQHHLRTPVTSVLWGLEATLKGEYGKLGNTLRDILTDMQASSKRLMKIVDDFLNITAIKIGTNILNLSTGSLRPAIEDIISELKPEIQAQNVSMSFPIDEAVWPSLKIDYDKIRESLFIVLENAVRYNHPGGTIDISPRVDGDTFELTVSNTGIGITHEEAGKIGSSLFYRGEGARQNHPIGMGIGLSVVKAMIRAHHGTFTIESKGKNEGARVTVRLPLKKGSE